MSEFWLKQKARYKKTPLSRPDVHLQGERERERERERGRERESSCNLSLSVHISTHLFDETGVYFQKVKMFVSLCTLLLLYYSQA